MPHPLSHPAIPSVPSGPAPTPAPIVILGAGIIGLSTSISLLSSPLIRERGIPIHIIADHFPSDALDPRYASSAAGAHHLSFADDGDERQKRWDRKTFKVMLDEWKAEGEATGLMLIKQTEYMSEGTHLKIYEEHPDFTVLPSHSLPKGIVHSVSFTSVTMTPAVYLSRLVSRFNALTSASATVSSPGYLNRMHRAHVSSLSDFTTPRLTSLLGSTPQLVINCTGLGSSALGGVLDPTVVPVRGQVIRVRAPWVREGYTRQIGKLDGGEGGERTYVIPRPDGYVILGGTREEGDWYPYPREETRKDILRRTREICPDLVPPYVRGKGLGAEREMEAMEEMVDAEVVGFRPARGAGVRLERGEDVVVEDGSGRLLKIVHNYGHGGAGWQACWGCAEDTVSLVEAALAQDGRGGYVGNVKAKL